MSRACVIGSGPNGLAAAIVLAQAGLRVDVFESADTPGGAVRTMPMTLPGFLHDAGAAVFPFAAGSPFFLSLPLGEYGLEWIHGEAPLAHPLDGEEAMVLERDLRATGRSLGDDSGEWQSMLRPFVDNWREFSLDILGPMLRIPAHPLRMARFGATALQSAESFASRHFRGRRARALFAGLAGHSGLSLDRVPTASVGLMFAAALHGVGWPVPRGGAQGLTKALVNYLQSLDGEIHVSQHIDGKAFREIAAEYEVVLCDMGPRQLVEIVGDRLPAGFRRACERFQYGPGAFKIDYALAEPVPWRSAECSRAITVHVGGSFEEIAASEATVAGGRIAEKPFVLAAQPSLFDRTRAPQGQHVLWAYCHVPNGSTIDMTERIEAQIERFAPGFRDCVLARHVSTPVALEAMNANLVGGDVSGGAMNLRQLLMRPTMRSYATGVRGLYLCSASTPPGGGVHGMCGYHAARAALHDLKMD